ncbi:MAG: hypothetical protein U0Q18_00030 [Bryobacteraceae bacterium]
MNEARRNRKTGGRPENNGTRSDSPARRVPCDGVKAEPVKPIPGLPEANQQQQTQSKANIRHEASSAPEFIVGLRDAGAN